MDWPPWEVFRASGTTLVDFFNLFALESCEVLAALSQVDGVVTGPELLFFMTGMWKERERCLNRGAVTLDVLCVGHKSRIILKKMLEDSAYRESGNGCRHILGEWSIVPKDKVTCMVRGQLHGRVVHLIELPRPVVEVALSRVYGSGCGTYLTGSGKVISLFPNMTFETHRVWMPGRLSGKDRALLESKYKGWTAMESPDPDGGDAEVGMKVRRTNDQHCWIADMNAKGGPREVQRPCDVDR